jgi:hypothetical protein
MLQAVQGQIQFFFNFAQGSYRSIKLFLCESKNEPGKYSVVLHLVSRNFDISSCDRPDATHRLKLFARDTQIQLPTDLQNCPQILSIVQI